VFLARTPTRRNFPASAVAAVYVDLVAPAMSEHVPASALSVHACHWKV
jgi:hypothetical protein